MTAPHDHPHDHVHGTLLNVSDRAREQVLEFRSKAAEPERQAMWVEVTGISGGQYTYNLFLNDRYAAGPDDIVERHGDLDVVVPSDSAEKVYGATVDWSDDLMQGGLFLINPNSPSPAVGTRPPADLSGDVAQRVLQVLEEQVNPAIAAHGGRADLVAVEDGTSYVRLSGGCQGCGMATVTLSQGIEVAIREGVPEVSQVVDVTDHASGSNPYFEASKK